MAVFMVQFIELAVVPANQLGFYVRPWCLLCVYRPQRWISPTDTKNHITFVRAVCTGQWLCVCECFIYTMWLKYLFCGLKTNLGWQQQKPIGERQHLSSSTRAASNQKPDKVVNSKHTLARTHTHTHTLWPYAKFQSVQTALFSPLHA